MKQTHIHWFRNDLRVIDQPFTQELSSKSAFFGIYIIDPRTYKWLNYGFRKTGLKRFQFLRENLIDLQRSLRSLGSELIVRVGHPEKLLPELVKQHKASLSFMMEFATEEREIQNAVIKELKGEDLKYYSGNFLIEPEELGIETTKFPQGFSGFRKKFEYFTKNREWTYIDAPCSLPPSPVKGKTIKASHRKIDKRSAFPLNGGETSAKKQVKHYFEETQLVKNYKTTRNGNIGLDYSSKFSPFLALGAISPRYVISKLNQFETDYVSNQSTYWLWFELLWREYFRHAGYHYKDRLFFHSGIFQKSVSKRRNRVLEKAWMNGQTDEEFVNAGLIELQTTGYSSNRLRQNIASYFMHNLGLDWRIGAAWFENQLLDYDVYSNQGNWMYIAGVAFDPKGGRPFDIRFQQERYDSNGAFRKLWL